MALSVPRPQPEVSVVVQTAIIFGMLSFGTMTTLSSKWLLETEAVGLDGEPKLFTKPWFLVLTMFLAMAMSLPVFYMGELYLKLRHGITLSFLRGAPVAPQQLEEQLLGGERSSEVTTSTTPWGTFRTLVPTDPPATPNKSPGEEHGVTPCSLSGDLLEEASENKSLPKPRPWEAFLQKSVFLQCGFPAVCDLLATGCGSMGLVYVSASVFAMFRGLNIVSTAMFSYFLLGRVLSAPRVLGLGLVMGSLLAVGWSAEKVEQEEESM